MYIDTRDATKLDFNDWDSGDLAARAGLPVFIRSMPRKRSISGGA